GIRSERVVHRVELQGRDGIGRAGRYGHRILADGAGGHRVDDNIRGWVVRHKVRRRAARPVRARVPIAVGGRNPGKCCHLKPFASLWREHTQHRIRIDVPDVRVTGSAAVRTATPECRGARLPATESRMGAEGYRSEITSL